MGGGKARGRYDAAAVHDGQSWWLVAADGKSPRSFASSAGSLPQEMLDAALAAGVGRMMFVVSSDMHLIDGVIPKNAGMTKVAEQLRLAIAESTGVDSDDSLVTGMTTAWPGVRKPFTVAASFDADAAEDIHASLEDVGISCAGFASLELALLAVWRRRASGRQSFVAVSSGRSFIVPPPRGTNQGPQTAACGLRHFAMDEENWRARFQRSAAGVDKKNPLHLLVFGDKSVSNSLTQAGYSDVVEEAMDEWLAAVFREVFASKPNRCRGISVPVANPWEPRRKFSSLWLVAAAAAVLLLPVLYKVACEQVTGLRCRAIAREAGTLAQRAEKVRLAQKALSNARAELAAEKAASMARIEMRRPMVAFIDISYFFCKHIGGSTELTSIAQEGDRISVGGRFFDPEDGIRINKAVVSYARDRNIQIVENAVDHEEDADGSSVNTFRLVFDCSKVGEVSE